MSWSSFWANVFGRLPIVLLPKKGGHSFGSHAERIRVRALEATANIGSMMGPDAMPSALEAQLCGHLQAAHSLLLVMEDNLPPARVIRLKMIAEAESRRLFGVNVTEADSYALAERTILIDMLSALMECRDKEGNLTIGSAKQPALDHLHHLIRTIPKYLYREAYAQHHHRERMH